MYEKTNEQAYNLLTKQKKRTSQTRAETGFLKEQSADTSFEILQGRRN
jgi:hypothetical protein